MFLYPYEYLSMVCNAKYRINVLANCSKPNFNTEKSYNTVVGPRGASAGPSKFFVYKLHRDELRGDYRPNIVLALELENDFYEHIPTHDEGLALTNKAAGINPSKKSRQLNVTKLKGDGTEAGALAD